MVHKRKRLAATLLISSVVLLSAVLVSSLFRISMAGEESVDANLKENASVGVGFNQLPEATTSLEVNLKPPGGKTIESSSYHDATGTLIWQRNTTSGSLHEWDGTGLTINSGHAVRFEAKLTSEGSGEGGGGDNISKAAIADVDIDADTSVPPLHSDGDAGHWPPGGNVAEDQAEAATAGGLALPPGLVEAFPTPDVLDPAKPYKKMSLKFNAKWNGPSGEIGKLKLDIPISGVRLYRLSDNSRVSSGTEIAISSNTYEDQFGILSDSNFGTAGVITATFTWKSELQGGNPNAIDTVRIYPASGVTIVGAYTEDEGPLYALANKPLNLHAKLDDDAAWPTGLPEWSVLSKPTGSGILDLPDGDAFLTFTPDIKGEYVLKASGGQSDTITIHVTEVRILTARHGASTWDAPNVTTEVAAGGLDSNSHKAFVRVTFDPALPSGTAVTLSLVNGSGFQPGAWWWSATRKRATLTMDSGGGSYVVGETSESLEFTSPTQLDGTLLSSNKVQPSTLLLQLGTPFTASMSKSVSFVVGGFSTNISDDLLVYNAWTSFDVTRKLGTTPIEGHNVKLVVSKVWLSDGTVKSPVLGSSEGTTEDLSAYVQLDGPLLSYRYQEGTTDADGVVTGTYYISNSDVIRFEISALDMSVAVDTP